MNTQKAAGILAALAGLLYAIKGQPATSSAKTALVSETLAPPGLLLGDGQALVSPDKQWRFGLFNGNVGFYNAAGAGTTVANLQGRGKLLQLEHDGELSVFSVPDEAAIATNNRLWRANTLNKGVLLAVTNSGRVEIRDENGATIWSVSK